jgi:penicillin G amidase
MSRFLRGCLIIFIIVVVIGTAAGAVWGRSTVRRSFPQVSGEISVPGLQAPVDIVRDAYGIPHIYASSQHDLFYAQGYVHAQDRFWQMDFWRHISQGRLGEMFGPGQLEQDAFLRTLGWARVARTELDSLDPTSRAILQSYADGVNAYMAEHSSADLSLEYSVLALMNAGYTPEPWEPLHSLAWAKVMAWDLGSNMDSEIMRARLLQTLTPEQVDQILPPYPAGAPVIVPEMSGTARDKTAPWAAELYSGPAAAALETAARRSAELSALLGPRGDGIGSNSWVIAGSLTNTGAPYLANDPHLGVQMPSIWYEVGMHCTPKTSDCPYEVTGYSFAGAPGVIIGHNNRIAWGFTNVGPDVQDLYIEKINPQNPNQYEFQGQWRDMTLVTEILNAPGQEPQELVVRYTHHGPIISGTYGPLEDFEQKVGISLPEGYAISLSWTALEPNTIFTGIWQFNRAQNWEEFRSAASFFAVPPQNLVYADVDGNIGYQMPGLIPIRAQGDGTLPVPGWTGEFEWTGYVPFEELPHVYNPPKGYIVTANNAVVGQDYPYLITTEWDYGFRARRIVELVENGGNQITAGDIQIWQSDNKNLLAEVLVPVLLQVPLEDEKLDQVRAILNRWDYQAHMDSAPAALFEVFWRNLLIETFHDDLPEYAWPTGGARWWVTVMNLLDEPGSPWWDDQETAELETRDDILRQAFSLAVTELEKEQGRDSQKWAWGQLHTVTFVNATLGTSGIGPIESLFNRGPYPTSGGPSIVNATGWNTRRGYHVVSLPSMRMIVDLGRWQNSMAVNTLGQSGHAYHPHYNDMVDLWRLVQFHGMHWEREEIEAVAEGTLRLIP